MNTVSQNIEALRLRKNLTPAQLAAKLGVTEETVSDWESGALQPDIEALIRMAEIFDTDISTLIDGLPDPALRKKEKKRLMIALGVLLVLGGGLWLLWPIAAQLRETYFMTMPMMLLRLCALPALWLVLGWTLMQGLAVLGCATPYRAKAAKAIRIVSLLVVLLYVALMLPYIIEAIRFMVLQLRYQQNPALYPDGFHYTFGIPLFLQRIGTAIMSVVYKLPALFFIPGLLFWLGKPTKKIKENQEHQNVR